MWGLYVHSWRKHSHRRSRPLLRSPSVSQASCEELSSERKPRWVTWHNIQVLPSSGFIETTNAVLIDSPHSTVSDLLRKELPHDAVWLLLKAAETLLSQRQYWISRFRVFRPLYPILAARGCTTAVPVSNWLAAPLQGRNWSPSSSAALAAILETQTYDASHSPDNWCMWLWCYDKRQ